MGCGKDEWDYPEDRKGFLDSECAFTIDESLLPEFGMNRVRMIMALPLGYQLLSLYVEDWEKYITVAVSEQFIEFFKKICDTEFVNYATTADESPFWIKLDDIGGMVFNCGEWVYPQEVGLC